MFKKIEELLESKTIDNTVATEINDEVSKALKELRDESANWRVKYQDLNTKFESVNETKLNLESKLSSIDEQIAKAKEDGKAELVGQLEDYKKSQQDLKANLEAIQSENANLIKTTGLQKELSKYQLIDSDIVSVALNSNVVLNDDGTIGFKSGSDVVSIEDGIKSYFDTKPHLLKSQGNNGSGANNNGYSSGIVNKKDMSAKDKFEYINKHGKDAYNKLK